MRLSARFMAALLSALVQIECFMSGEIAYVDQFDDQLTQQSEI
jgi:hypothetical protein